MDLKQSEKTLTVLLVEDNQIFRTMALKLFPVCKKVTASNAEQGLSHFKKHKPDITFLDIGLPDGNGLDLLKSLKTINPDAFVVMLTMSNVSTDVYLAIKRGAAGYIVKPYAPDIFYTYFKRFRLYKQKLNDFTPEEKVQFYHDMFEEEDVQAASKLEDTEFGLIPTREEIIATWKVLFVDDFLNNRVHAKKYIEKIGYKVDITDDGNNAIKMVEDEGYHLIFLDCKMPQMDGYEATQIIRSKEAQGKLTPAIIIGLADSQKEADNGRWQKCGMDHYLVKPIQFTKLAEITEKYVNEYIEKTGSSHA